MSDLTFHQAVDLFVKDMRSEGRINSKNTERTYRAKLGKHGEDMANRSPAETTRADVKTTLRRWEGNTQVHGHAILASFYRWTVEEGIRTDNPAHAVRPPRKRQPLVYKMTQNEVITLLREAKKDQRDDWTVRLGVLAGLRAQELVGLQGRHLERKGWVWVSGGIAKGMKERWIPVLSELEEAAEEIRSEIGTYQFVLSPRKWTNGDRVPGGTMGFHHDRQLTYSALHKAVVKLGVRAGIAGRVTPHTLRHAFGDLVARRAGLRAAQTLMGHASVQTTERYTNELSLDDLAASVQGIELGLSGLG